MVWQDEHLAIIDKPAGLVVHPAAGHRSGTLVNALLHWAREEEVALEIDEEERPGIVHRIDKDTSGLLVVAFDDATMRGLQSLFAAHDIERRYRAVVYGTRLADEGTKVSELGRHPKDRKRFASLPVGRGAGKRAVTHWKVLARGHALALVECRLETGRTHQIRVHLSEMGYPIVADPAYGVDNKRSRRDLRTTVIAQEEAAGRAMPRLALHAAVLGFVHPITGEKLRFESPDPDDLATLIKAFVPG
ncbi:MAG: RluA family pseudouridine synthase [Myxococcota bacterium]